ncbi:uncharacterized protein LOC129586574 [Paramacrobiotus metropolitanus]|uniref:uncharacterized protein LOC129586574 n=1 Tax=Paramacrobiotus metropolitanus TaxID=2943436 RepID=UPI002445BF22|nr:uncharacterized protein LOC129586574 [Paramacrobiotus metropolitanus]
MAAGRVQLRFPGVDSLVVHVSTATPDLYEACRAEVRRLLQSDNFRFLFYTPAGIQPQRTFICASEEDLQLLVRFYEMACNYCIPLTVQGVPREPHPVPAQAIVLPLAQDTDNHHDMQQQQENAHGQSASGMHAGIGPNMDEESIDGSAESIVGKIFAAVELMLPKGRESDVLGRLNDQISYSLAVASGRRNADQPASTSSASFGTGYSRHSMTDFRASNAVLNAEGRGTGESSTSSDDRPRIRMINGQQMQAPPTPDAAKPPPRFQHLHSLLNAAPAVPLPPGTPAPKQQRKRDLLQHKQRSMTFAAPTMAPTMAPLVSFPGTVTQEPRRLADIGRGKPGFVCPRCPQTKATRSLVLEHLEFHGSGGRWTCQECDFSTDSHTRFKFHVKVHQATLSGGEAPAETGTVGEHAAQDIYGQL